MQTYNSAPQRVGKTAPGTKQGLIQKAMAKPAPKTVYPQGKKAG